MKQSNTRRVGLILILLISLQYIEVVSFHLHKRKFGYHQDDFDKTKNALLPQRSKRYATAIFNAIMFAAMVGTVGFDIYLHVTKCCDIVPKACTNKNRYEEVHNEFTNKSVEYERQYTEAKNLNENIDLLNVYMERLWLKTEDMETQITALMTSLDANFTSKLSELETAIIESDKNYDNFDDVDFEYYSVFDNPISTALRLQGFVSWALLDRIKLYVRKEIAEAATTLIWQNPSHFSSNIEVPTTSTFSALKTQILNSETVTSIQKWIANNPKTVTFFKNVAYGIFTAAFVGYEIIRALERVEDCEEIRDESQKAIDKVEAALEDLAECQTELDELHSDMKTYYETLTSQLKSTSFIAYVEYTKSILQNSSSDYVDVESDIKKIDDFLENISTTDDKHVIESITENLEIAFGHIVYLLACSTSQIDLINLAKTRCIEGIFTIEMIVDSILESQQSFNCSGWITLLEKDNFTALLENLVESDGYQKNCLLNNELLKEEICSKQANGDTVEKIAESYESTLSVEDVTYLFDSCEKHSVTDLLSSIICSKKESGTILTEIIESYEHYNETQLNSTYENCQLTDEQIEDICNYKSKGYSLANVQQTFALYDESTIESTYNSCTLPDLPSYLEETVCTLLGVMTKEEVLSLYAFQFYNEDSVSNTADKC